MHPAFETVLAFVEIMIGMRSSSKTQSTYLWTHGKYIYANDPKRGTFTKSADLDESGSALFATISTLFGNGK